VYNFDMPDISVEVIEGPDAGKRQEITAPIVVGRDPGSDFVLDDEQTSRRHARITPAADHAVIEDLGSRNGTFIDNSELQAPARLDPGDELLIGVSVIALRTASDLAGRPTAVRPVPPGLAVAPKAPTYVKPTSVEEAAVDRKLDPAIADLEGLRDVRVRASARVAPLAIFVLAALAVIIYLALR
jgi:pSer/pThr/pTyr-binding forkhead associated (FHA) protein